MTHGKHRYLMLGLAALAAGLFFTRVGGGSLSLLWVVGCGAMMFFMMRGMGSGGGHQHGGQDSSREHDDKPSFSKRHP